MTSGQTENKTQVLTIMKKAFEQLQNEAIVKFKFPSSLSSD